VVSHECSPRWRNPIYFFSISVQSSRQSGMALQYVLGRVQKIRDSVQWL
jgi:hypothetical protein